MLNLAVHKQIKSIKAQPTVNKPKREGNHTLYMCMYNVENVVHNHTVTIMLI